MTTTRIDLAAATAKLSQAEQTDMVEIIDFAVRLAAARRRHLAPQAIGAADSFRRHALLRRGEHRRL